MLDVHAVALTPGAATVLSGTMTVATGDGAQTAGVPIGGSSGTLKMWGYQSLTADTIGAVKLTSQDMIDAIDGITVVPGAASLLNQFYDYTTLPYKTGTRQITAGTNTGVTAGSGFLIDEYAKAKTVAGSYNMGNVVVVGATTFGGALTKGAWGTQAYAAPNLPSGQYIILGAYVSAITNVALIRFTHNDFQGLHPGFPVANWELSMAATAQVAMRDELVLTAHGEQFIYLGQIMGRPQCPQFTVSNASTGLVIEMLSEVADTPVVNLVIARIGD